MTDTTEQPTLRIISGPGSQDGPALVAAAIPASPPAEWFDRKQVPQTGGPLTFTADGRVYGLLAPSNVDHIGLPGQRRRAPSSRSGYQWFHTGQVRCDDDSLVSTGRITMNGGHADLVADARAAAAHYDDVCTAIADVVAWDTPAGVMCAGAARPGLTADQIRTAMASPPSGDWRPIGNDLEMVGAHLVNVPGFATRRLLAASGDEPVAAAADTTEALIASGNVLPRIVVAAPADPEPTAPNETSSTIPEDTMTDTTDTQTESHAEPVTAAAEPAPPAITTDQVVTASGELPPGLVASVDSDAGTALVQFEVPVIQLADAGHEGRSLLASAQRDRLRDKEVAGLKDQLGQALGAIETLTASIETDREDRKADARDAALLDAIPSASAGKLTGPAATLLAAGSSGKTRMYFFAGRNTGIAAKSVDEARERKQRGSDDLVGVRDVIPGEFGPDGTTWSRLRLDGKLPGESKHDKRGLGPAPKRR